MAKIKIPTSNRKPAEPPEIKTVSSSIVYSCYLASTAIVVLSGFEVYKQFKLGNPWGGLFYVVLAVAGVLFSVFITKWNQRNKKLLAEKKNKS